MKISGPKPPEVMQPPASAPPSEAARSSGPSFAEVLEGPAAPSAATGLLQEIGAKLQSGTVTAAQAVEQLIEAIVREQLGQASPALAARLREALRGIIAEDPLLGEKMKRLGSDEG